MTSTDPTAWAIYGRKTGFLRYVVTSDEEVRDLSEYYNVVPLYPVPTSPADDVREALAAIVKRVSQRFGGPSLAEFANDPPTRKHYATADAILAEFVVNDVPGGCIYCSSSGVVEDYEGDRPCANCDGTGTPRPRGTTTDAEVEAGAQALYAADPILYALPEWREKIGTPKPWSVLNEGTRDVYRKRARAALKAAAEARNA